jgi:DinB superfamily
VDVTELRSAYDRFLESVRDPGFREPADGEWRAEEVLAHVILTDRLIAETVAEVLNGRNPRFESLAAQCVPYLGAIVDAAGGWEGLVEEARRGAEALIAVVGRLTEEQVATSVPAYIWNAGQVLVDGPMTIGEIVHGGAAMHLPLHTGQLAGLREVRA